jgi:hypothetical protein
MTRLSAAFVQYDQIWIMRFREFADMIGEVFPEYIPEQDAWQRSNSFESRMVGMQRRPLRNHDDDT